MSTREPPRSRPFLMEFLIVVGLLWAGVQWVRRAPESASPHLAAAVAPDPQGTGSIGMPARDASSTIKPAADPDTGAVRNVLGILEILGRR